MRESAVHVLEAGVELAIPFSACVLYHGRDSIGGLALGWRLFAWALPLLCEASPERRLIAFRTAFAGPGVRDASEMVARTVSRGAYTLLDPERLNAPEGVYGRMYFEISVGEKTAAMALRPGVLPQDFIQTGRAFKAGDTSPERAAHWRGVKEALAQTVLSLEDFGSILQWQILEHPPRH